MIKDYITPWSTIFLLIIFANLASAIWGVFNGNWSFMGYSIIILLLVYLFYQICDRYFWDRMPIGENKVYASFKEGDVFVEFHHSEHSMTGPFNIDLNGRRVAKVYRGRTANVPLPRGPNNIEIYMMMSKKFKLNEVYENMRVYMWPKYFDPDFVGVACLDGDEAFDDGEVKRKFETVCDNYEGFNSLSIPINALALFAFIGILKLNNII